MQGFWIGLWTIVWFAGLLIFFVLSVMVIIFGGKDLASLLLSLRKRHQKRHTKASEDTVI